MHGLASQYAILRCHASPMIGHILLAKVTIHEIKHHVFLDSFISDCEWALRHAVMLFSLSHFVLSHRVIVHERESDFFLNGLHLVGS
jgi:hypothetical protein